MGVKLLFSSIEDYKDMILKKNFEKRLKKTFFLDESL